MKLKTLLLVPLLLFVGCTPPETAAVKTLAASKGLIESEMGKHGECHSNLVPPPTTAICTALNQAIPAQHAAVLILDTYCSSTNYLTNGGPCSPPTDATVKADLQAKLQTALNNLTPIIASIKSAAGGN
jgi:hypothetical protein